MRLDGGVVSLACLKFVGKAKRGWVAAKSRGAPAARRRRLGKVWNEIDADGSGTLDRDELKSVLLRMGRSEETIDIDEVMAQVDDDGSGDVDFREFTEWFLRMEMDELQGLEDTLVDEELLEEAMLNEEFERYQREAEEASRAAEEERQRELQMRLEQLWNEVDKDGSGELDAGELKVVLLRMGRNDDITDVMQQVDSDGSGDVDFAEFCAWFKQMDLAELRALEEGMENAKHETATKTSIGSLRFISKLKKGQREKRKAAFLERHNSIHRMGSSEDVSAFRNVKQEKQIEIARSQLADAQTVEDFHQLSAALRRARKLAYVLDEHTLHAFCDTFEQSLDDEYRLKVRLHNSDVIKREIVRFWDLMAFISETTMSPHVRLNYWHRARAHLMHGHNKVSRDGYTALHIRIGKAVHDAEKHKKWSRKIAIESAQSDWFDDVARFSGDAGISAWYAKVRKAFQSEARATVTRLGWTALFKTFDTDGSGSLEVHEFISAVRSSGITEDTMSSTEIRQLFRHVDADRSGEVDGAEFAEWLRAMEDSIYRDSNAGAQISGWQTVISTFVSKCDARVTQMGWQAIFTKHDDDGNGELDQAEFICAVRTECPNLEVGDSELEEMFGIIDGDGGGSISGEEFYEGLAMDTETTNNMTYDVFSHSMLELADYWATEHSEHGYVQFLRAVFRAITIRNPATIARGMPTINGHPREDVSVMREPNPARLKQTLRGMTIKALARRAATVGISEELIAAAMDPGMADNKAALIDIILADEIDGGMRPNYMLRDLDNIVGVVSSGEFVDPYADQEVIDVKVIVVKTKSKTKRIQRQTKLIRDTRIPYPLGRVQGQIGSPRDRDRERKAYQESKYIRHDSPNGQAQASPHHPEAFARLTQGYSSVPPLSPRTSASPERQRMIHTASTIATMALPVPPIPPRPSTPSNKEHKAYFATGYGKWYCSAKDERAPIWAHERAGTAAADCVYPTWLGRPTRALHGYLVYVNKNQAALAIQRIFRGWCYRITSRRLREEQEYDALLEAAEAKAVQMIQARYRGHVQRVLLALEKKHAITIQSRVREWLRRARNSKSRHRVDIAGQAPAAALANLRSRFAELGENGMMPVPALSQVLAEIGLPLHIVSGACKLLSTGKEASATYSFDDACALLAAVGNTTSSQDGVLTEQQQSQQAIAIREALRTSCVLTEHELGDVSAGREVEEAELTNLLQLLRKPAELRTDKDLELLDRRWACGYTWFQQLPSGLRREMCRYLRGGLLSETELIYLVGEPLTAVFFVARGCVKLQPDGSDVGTREGRRPAWTVGPGEDFGLPSQTAKDTQSLEWLGHERRTEVAEATKGTVLLALGIEQWAWTRAERVACERAMIGRLLRSTPLFANISSEAHMALAAAMQCNALRIKEGEALVKQGDGRADRLCLLTSGEVKLTVTVRDRALDRGGGVSSAFGAAAGQMTIDVGRFNARGEITGETTLLEPHDPENKWKAEASLVACRGPVRGFAIHADELSRILIGHCHQAILDISQAAHHLATERKVMIWQRLRKCSLFTVLISYTFVDTLSTGANQPTGTDDVFLARSAWLSGSGGVEIGASSSEMAAVANHLSLPGKGTSGTGSRHSSMESIGIRSSYHGSVLAPEQFTAAMLREGVGAPSYLLGGHRRPQAVRIVSSLTGVPKTEAMNLDAMARDSRRPELPDRALTAGSGSGRTLGFIPTSADSAVMSARTESHLKTPEFPRLEGGIGRAQTARSASERHRAMDRKFGRKFVRRGDGGATGGVARSGGGGPVGWGFANVSSIRGELGTPRLRSPRSALGGLRKPSDNTSRNTSGKISKGLARNAAFVPVPPTALPHMLHDVDRATVRMVPMFGMRPTQLTT